MLSSSTAEIMPNTPQELGVKLLVALFVSMNQTVGSFWLEAPTSVLTCFRSQRNNSPRSPFT